MKNEILLFEYVSLLCLVIEFFIVEDISLYYICDLVNFSLVFLFFNFLSLFFIFYY